LFQMSELWEEECAGWMDLGLVKFLLVFGDLVLGGGDCSFEGLGWYWLLVM